MLQYHTPGAVRDNSAHYLATAEVESDADEAEEEISNSPDDALWIDTSPYDIEHIEDYNEGGHLPVHLGDSLGGNKPSNGHYRVILKLGCGGSANV